MKKTIPLFLCISLSSITVFGNDAGDLIFPSDYNYRPRVELIYENVQRDVDITSQPQRAKDQLTADVFALRIQTDVGPFTRLDFDVGALGGNQGGHKLMAGVGLRYLALDQRTWRAGAFSQIRYARDVTSRIDMAGRDDVPVRYDWVEGDAGFLVSYRLRVADQFTVAPYVGPVLSILRLSGDERDEDRRGERFRAEEDTMFGVAAGIGFEFQGMNGIRFETRYFDDFSVSVAASFVF